MNLIEDKSLVSDGSEWWGERTIIIESRHIDKVDIRYWLK